MQKLLCHTGTKCFVPEGSSSLIKLKLLPFPNCTSAHHTHQHHGINNNGFPGILDVR